MTKQIIDGKTYNTETATFICAGESDGNTSVTDFRYWRAKLYVTKKGAYFIDGRGGAMSRFSVRRGQNEWGGSEGIRVLDPDEALAFAETHSDCETVESFFSHMVSEA